jgi:hypothetical protein
MSAYAYDHLNQLHEDLLKQLELGRRLLDLMESVDDAGEAHQLAGELLETITDTDEALSATLGEEGLTSVDEAARAASCALYDAQQGWRV